MQLSAFFSNICWHGQGAQLVPYAAGPLDEGPQPMWDASKWALAAGRGLQPLLGAWGPSACCPAATLPNLSHCNTHKHGVVARPRALPLLLPQPARPVPVRLQEGGSSAETEENGSCSLTLRPVPQGSSSEVPFWVWIIVAIVGFMLVICCCLVLGLLLYRWAPPGKGVQGCRGNFRG